MIDDRTLHFRFLRSRFFGGSLASSNVHGFNICCSLRSEAEAEAKAKAKA